MAMTDEAQAELTRATEHRLRLEGRLKAGASWFYWLSGLSMINTVIAHTGGNWTFIFGLGITQMVDGLAFVAAENAPDGGLAAARVVAVVLDLLVAGVFVGFGLVAHRRKLWAFNLGMLLYLLDAAIFLLVEDYLGAGFHAFVLVSLWGGRKAAIELNVMIATQGPEPGISTAVIAP